MSNVHCMLCYLDTVMCSREGSSYYRCNFYGVWDNVCNQRVFVGVGGEGWGHRTVFMLKCFGEFSYSVHGISSVKISLYFSLTKFILEN